MSSEDNVKVRLTVHRDVLVIETVSPEETDYPGWTPAGPGRFGCVITNTRVSLGVSDEALTWLRGVKKSRDNIGDVDWFACDDGNKAFGWLGGVYAIKDRTATGSRSYKVFPDDCVHIANDTPAEAKAVVDAELDANPICGKFSFTLLGQEQCRLPVGHPSPCVFTSHDCADCGTSHGTCKHCGTTHGDNHSTGCPHHP